MNSDHQVRINGGSGLSYHVFVQTLVKKFKLAVQRLGGMPQTDREGALAAMVDGYAHKLEVCHSAIGVATEACEVADVLKAYAIYGKELDRAALVKELGDLRFWIMDIQNKFHISDTEITQGNADKLAERYKKLSYTDEQAIARMDKKYIVVHQGVVVAGPYEHEYEAKRFVEEFGYGEVMKSPEDAR